MDLTTTGSGGRLTAVGLALTACVMLAGGLRRGWPLIGHAKTTDRPPPGVHVTTVATVAVTLVVTRRPPSAAPIRSPPSRARRRPSAWP